MSETVSVSFQIDGMTEKEIQAMQVLVQLFEGNTIRLHGSEIRRVIRWAHDRYLRYEKESP